MTIDFQGIIHTLALWRRRGSTTVAARAVGRDGTFVAHNHVIVDDVTRKHGVKHALTLAEFPDYRSNDHTGPVVFDHWVVLTLAQEAFRFQTMATELEAQLKRLQGHLSKATVTLSTFADYPEVEKLRSFLDSDGLTEAITEVVTSRNRYRDQRDVQARALRAIRICVNRDGVLDAVMVGDLRKILEELKPKTDPE